MKAQITELQFSQPVRASLVKQVETILREDEFGPSEALIQAWLKNPSLAQISVEELKPFVVKDIRRYAERHNLRPQDVEEMTKIHERLLILNINDHSACVSRAIANKIQNLITGS